ncbi:hypothetical protein F0562_016989 [Nyssa sinensis]|uniref:Uncharacterized protein n=1 Tax=Nyssa sinensis TaxID=561372 RepID=A0A5J4ZCY0_9ASTE|nr:hypothetical protein F0562_016989 [Nyssa sinensis]
MQPQPGKFQRIAGSDFQSFKDLNVHGLNGSVSIYSTDLGLLADDHSSPAAVEPQQSRPTQPLNLPPAAIKDNLIWFI